MPEFHPWGRCSAEVNKHTPIIPASNVFHGMWWYLQNSSLCKADVETVYKTARVTNINITLIYSTETENPFLLCITTLRGFYCGRSYRS